MQRVDIESSARIIAHVSKVYKQCLLEWQTKRTDSEETSAEHQNAEQVGNHSNASSYKEEIACGSPAAACQAPLSPRNN